MKLEGVTIINGGNPLPICGDNDGFLFTVSPSTAKKARAYYTDKPVTLTEYERRMPGVVVAQNRGMMFSSCREMKGFNISIDEINWIIVDEKSRKLAPVDDENVIAWKGTGAHVIKDVVADGAGLHFFGDEKGIYLNLWLKLAKIGYGVKGMIMPGRKVDVGTKVIDHWKVERTITMGNTLLINSSMVKGIDAYDSLEEFIAHSKDWGLTDMLQQWQSGAHKVDSKREMGTQPNSTNLQLTFDDIEELLKPEARQIYTMKYPEVAWKRMANIRTSRGRAIAARPSLIYKDLVMNQIDTRCGNHFLKLAQGKAKMEGSYMKMFPDEYAYSLVYVHNMGINEAAKKAASVGLHGQIRVNPSFAGRTVRKDENGNTIVTFKKETHLDKFGRWVEAALVRYPHGAPSETISVKVYLDSTIPNDVIMFPLPVANDNGTIPVSILYAFRLQGADFDGDAVVAFTEKVWLEAQKRNAGKPYMIIPVNTESTDKDRTLVTNDPNEKDRVEWSLFCEMKVQSLSNQVGLIATSMKYLFSQEAMSLKLGLNPELYGRMIVDHACAMGDDIDEFKHGKAKNDIALFMIPGECGEKDRALFGPYFNRYSCKFKDEEAFEKAVFTKKGKEKKPGCGILDMYAVTIEKLMEKAGLKVEKTVAKASDGKDRFFFAVHPVKWEKKNVDLFTAEHGEGYKLVCLPKELEKIYGLKHEPIGPKDLFLTLYRDHAATCCDLYSEDESEEDRDNLIKAISKMNERYALAKIAIVAWTKAMALAKTGKSITAEEAMRIFTTLMVQHTSSARSIIETITETGKFLRRDGTTFVRTVSSAQLMFNYFLDVCGDGLFLMQHETPTFDKVSEKILAAADVCDPDMGKANELALKELALIDKIVDGLSEEEVIDGLTRKELNDLMDDGSFEAVDIEDMLW